MGYRRVIEGYVEQWSNYYLWTVKYLSSYWLLVRDSLFKIKVSKNWNEKMFSLWYRQMKFKTCDMRTDSDWYSLTSFL